MEIDRGDLDLVNCDDCGFVFNAAFDSAKIAYGNEYDNTQTCSPAFSEYLDNLVRHMVVERSVRNCKVVEVGCGKGVFLRKLAEFDGSEITGFGFDPSFVGETEAAGGRLHFEKQYYDSACADVRADVVVCRHVIEHVAAPLDLLGNVRKALRCSPEARIFFETPCVEWILQNRVIWDFFYEHCSYFTASSLTTAFETAGLAVDSVEHVFDGQYLWLEGRVGRTAASAHRDPGSISRLSKEFADSEQQLASIWRQKIHDLADTGRVAVWGAGAKGVTFVNMMDPERRLISCVVDLNPQKQRRFIPGTGHPIVDYRHLRDYGVRSAVLMNPVYREENERLLTAAGLKVTLVHDFESADIETHRQGPA